MLSFETNLCFTGRRFDAYFFFPFILLLFSVHVVNASNDNVIVVGFVHFCFFFPCSFSFTLIFSGWLEYRNSVKIGTGLVNAMKIHIFIVELRSEKQQRERQRDRAQRKMYIFTVISSYLFTFTVCVVSTLCLAFFDVCELFFSHCLFRCIRAKYQPMLNWQSFFPPAFSNDFENCVLSFNCSTDFMLFVSLFTRFNKIQRLCVVSFLVVNIQFGVGVRFE